MLLIQNVIDEGPPHGNAKLPIPNFCPTISTLDTISILYHWFVCGYFFQAQLTKEGHRHVSLLIGKRQAGVDPYTGVGCKSSPCPSTIL